MNIAGKLLLVCFFCSSSVYSGVVKYDVVVDPKTIENCPVLSIIFKNAGSEIMYFQPEEPRVLLINSSGKILPFIGLVVDRPPYTVEEHLKLMPGEFYSSEIFLNSSYGLRESGRYKVSVNIDYFDPVLLRGYHKGNVSRNFFYAGNCQQGGTKPQS